MARTLHNPDAVATLLSAEFDDTKTTGSGMETNPTNLIDNINNCITMLKEFSGSSDWYLRPADNTEVFQTTKANARQVFAFRTNILTDVTVTNSQNWEVLSVAGGEAPTVTASVGAVTTEGAVVAYHTGTFGTHSLDEVAGPDTLNPVNLCLLVDASTGDAITSSNGFEIKALIQSESNVDGHTFNDTNQQVQLSFVERNSGGTDLVATAVADIEDKTINYSYPRRLQYQNLPESVFLAAFFADNVGAVDVTLSNAANNQTGNVTYGTKDLNWVIPANGDHFRFQDGSANIIATFELDGSGNGDVTLGSSGASSDVTIAGTNLDINVSNDVTILNGLKVDDGAAGTTINIGSTPNQIDVAGNLTVTATAGSMTLNSTSAVCTVSSTTSGNVAITSADAVNITAGNEAAAAGNDVNITAGDGGGANNGGDIVVTTGNHGTSGSAGTCTVTGPNDEDEALLTLTSTGTNGDSAQIFVGDSDPDTVVTGLAGSLFLRDTGATGEVYVNTSNGSGTSWSKLDVSGVSSADRQDVYDNQGATAVTITTDATLDLNAAGTEWLIRDEDDATLFSILENSDTSATTIAFGAQVDVFDCNAASLDFDGATLDVELSGAFSIDGTGASNVTAASGTLTLSSSSTGDVSVTAADAVNVTAGNEAAAAGNDVNITAGDGGGANNGGDIVVTTGNHGTSGSAGTCTVTGPNDEDEALLTLTSTGTNGDSAQVFVGDSNPSGSVTGLAGSLFLRDTGSGGEVYVNTSTGSGTAWTKLEGAGGATLQSAYEAGSTITTNATEGDITFQGTEDFIVGGSVTVSFDTTDAISLDADVASNFTVAGAGLTLSTTTSGNVGVTAADAVNITAGNEAAAAGNDVNITAGDGGGANDGGDIVITTGDHGTAGNAGTCTITGPNDEDEALLTLTSTGTNGDSAQIFVGDSNPSGSVTGLAGSLFLRDTASSGEVYVNTSNGSGTSWTRLESAGGSTLQSAYEAGNTITTNATEGDITFQGTEDFIVGGSVTVSFDTTDAISLDADVASNFTVNGAGLTLSTTTSGDVSVSSAGTVTIDATGGTLTVQDTNVGSNVAVTTAATATTTDVGDITLTTGANTNGTSGDAGDIVLTGGASTSGQAGRIQMVPGDGTTDGYIWIDSALASTSQLQLLDNSDGSNGESIGLFVRDRTPESVVTSNQGGICFVRDATDSSNGKLYLKETGTGNTGWAEVLTASDNPVTFSKTVGVTTGAVSANTNVSGTTTPVNLDATLGDYSGVTFTTRVNVYVNGSIQRNGADAAANFDVYPGTDTSTGDLKFEYALRSGDTITMEIFEAL